MASVPAMKRLRLRAIRDSRRTSNIAHVRLENTASGRLCHAKSTGRVIDYRSIEDEVKPLKDMMAQLPPISNQNMQSQIIADDGEILVAYQLNGREMRATLSTIAVISHVRFVDIMNPGQISMETITDSPSQITIVTAPNGQLDFGLRKRVQKSIRFTPEWSQAIEQYHAQKNKTIMDANRAAHATRMHAIHQTSQIMNGIYEDRQIASDHNQREFIESIRGVDLQ